MSDAGYEVDPWDVEEPAPVKEKQRRGQRSDKGVARGPYRTKSRIEEAEKRQLELADKESRDIDPLDEARAMFKISDKQWNFLNAYIEKSNWDSAVKIAGIPRLLATRWVREDPEFRSMFNICEQLVAERIKDVGIQVAMGIERPMMYQGVPVMNPVTNKPMMETEYSPKMIAFMLQSLMPEKFNQKKDVQVTTNVNLQIAIPPRDSDESAWERRNLETQAAQKIIDITPSK